MADTAEPTFPANLRRLVEDLLGVRELVLADEAAGHPPQRTDAIVDVANRTLRALAQLGVVIEQLTVARDETLADDRLGSSSADVITNAPLALTQAALTSRARALTEAITVIAAIGTLPETEQLPAQ